MELRSDLRAIGAIAAEADLFAGFILEHHSTRRYAAGHTEYLQMQTRKLADKLSRSQTQSQLEAVKDTAKALADQLSDALKDATGADPGQPDAWTRLRELTISIHERANRTQART